MRYYRLTVNGCE
jgi:deoxyribonuclease V